MSQIKRKPIISDIATAAGVSKTTVSRYINGHFELMSKATQERIRTVIELLDYQPNSVARSLKTKKTNQIGVLLSLMDTPFSTALAVGISDYLSSRGYEPLFVDCQQSAEREKNLIEIFLSKGVDGLLVNTVSGFNPTLVRASCEGCPVVLCDRFVDDHNFNIVTIEQNQGFYHLIQHLKASGYTRPVFFTQRCDGNSTRKRRRNAFIEAVKDIYHYDPTDDIYIVSKTRNITALQQLDKLYASLSKDDKPVIIGTNSDTTVKCYRAIMHKGLEIPNDIGLCGPEDWDWDNDLKWTTLLKPAITSLHVPTKQMGYRAAERLITMIESKDKSAQTIVLPCTLEIRESTQLNQER